MASKAETDILERAGTATIEDVDGKTQPKDVDDALRFAIQTEDIDWTKAEERKVVWKIDAVILSLVRSSSLGTFDFCSCVDISLTTLSSSSSFSAQLSHMQIPKLMALPPYSAWSKISNCS